MRAGDFAGILSRRQALSIHQADARINVWHGSIRSGKTIASLLRWVIYVASAPRGGQLVIVGKTLQTIERNVLEPLMDAGLFGPLSRHTTHTTGASTATILGRNVWLIGANDTKAEGKLRGLTCAGAYVDEITLIPEGFWNQLLGRLSVPGAQLFGTTNPDSPAHWFRKKFLLRAAELGVRVFKFTLADNPGLTKAYIDAISAEYVGLWYRRFILGDWVAAEGAIYDQWDPAVHVIGDPNDPAPLPPLPSGATPIPMRWWLGVDYGTTNAFSAILSCLDSAGRVVAVDEWRWDSRTQRRQMTDLEYAQGLRAWLDARAKAWDSMPDFAFIDPSAASFKRQLWLADTPESTHHLDGVRDADNDVLDGIRTVSSALASGRHVVHARCNGLVDEFPGYSWDPKATEQGVDKPLKIEDHSLDADRYAVVSGRWMWESVPLELAA